MMVKREQMAVVCSWVCIVLMSIGGSLKQLVRVLRVEEWIPPCWPSILTISGWNYWLMSAMAMLSGVYLAIFCCVVVFWETIVEVGEFNVVEFDVGNTLCGKGLVGLEVF
jgi:hypothetical protein